MTPSVDRSILGEDEAGGRSCADRADLRKKRASLRQPSEVSSMCVKLPWLSRGGVPEIAERCRRFSTGVRVSTDYAANPRKLAFGLPRVLQRSNYGTK